MEAIMPKKTKHKKIDDDLWIKDHFEKIIDKYGDGTKYLVVAAGEPFIGPEPAKLFEKARRKHPGVIPTGMRIPRPSDFVCALFLKM